MGVHHFSLTLICTKESLYFTKCDGLQVDGIQEMGKQCPL